MPSVQQDSNFAKSILEVVIEDNVCKQHIVWAAEQVNRVILGPLISKLKSGTELAPYEVQAMNYLIGEHSREGMQWGGVLQSHSKQQIIADTQLQQDLLQNLSANLAANHIKQCSDMDSIYAVMKAITDCSYIYVEKYIPELRSPQFELIKNSIFPTQEEFEVRVSRIEKGQGAYIATSYGIGTELGKDIALEHEIPVNAERRHKTGKSVFAGVDVYDRINIVATQ